MEKLKPKSEIKSHIKHCNIELPKDRSTWNETE